MDKTESKNKATRKVKISPLYAESIQAANKRGRDLIDAESAIRDAQIETIHGQLVLSLTFKGGSGVTIPVKVIEEISNASPAQLRQIEVSPFRDSIRFPSIDADIYVPGLIAEVMKPVVWPELARRAGKKSSPKKSAAARENGRKGGRPTKRQKQVSYA